mgnify:CR=1 FL=1
MNNNNSADGPSSVLRRAREFAGRNPIELAAKAGMNPAAYFDLESHDDDVLTAVPVRTLQAICDELSLSAYSLFAKFETSGEQLSTNLVIGDRIREHLATTSLSLADFETKIGYEIGSVLSCPSAVLDWNIDCLRSVCQAIGVDWRSALQRNEGY